MKRKSNKVTITTNFGNATLAQKERFIELLVEAHKIPEITWHYVGDESPEKRKESEKNLSQAYDRIFKIAMENIRQPKQQKLQSQGDG